MEKISYQTRKKREVIDVTDKISASLDKLGASNGVCHISVMHTTAAVTVCELESGNSEDLLSATENMLPELDYSHSEDAGHVGAHIMSSMIGPSVTLPVESGILVLGTWQRVALVELDGPRERTIISIFTESG